MVTCPECGTEVETLCEVCEICYECCGCVPDNPDNYEGGGFYTTSERPPFLFIDKDDPGRSRYYQ